MLEILRVYSIYIVSIYIYIVCIYSVVLVVLHPCWISRLYTIYHLHLYAALQLAGDTDTAPRCENSLSLVGLGCEGRGCCRCWSLEGEMCFCFLEGYFDYSCLGPRGCHGLLENWGQYVGCHCYDDWEPWIADFPGIEAVKKLWNLDE